jgi:hypothetical protein
MWTLLWPVFCGPQVDLGSGDRAVVFEPMAAGLYSVEVETEDGEGGDRRTFMLGGKGDGQTAK